MKSWGCPPSKKCRFFFCFLVQDFNEWKHLRLELLFVQACYQRTTMAAKDGTRLHESESCTIIVVHTLFLFISFFFSNAFSDCSLGETITRTHVHCLCCPDKQKCPNVSVVGDCWLSALITSQKVGDQTPRQQDTKVNQRECEDLRLCSSWKQKLLQRSSDGPAWAEVCCICTAARDPKTPQGTDTQIWKLYKVQSRRIMVPQTFVLDENKCLRLQTIQHKCTDGICRSKAEAHMKSQGMEGITIFLPLSRLDKIKLFPLCDASFLLSNAGFSNNTIFFFFCGHHKMQQIFPVKCDDSTQ